MVNGIERETTRPEEYHHWLEGTISNKIHLLQSLLQQVQSFRPVPSQPNLAMFANYQKAKEPELFNFLE